MKLKIALVAAAAMTLPSGMAYAQSTNDPTEPVTSTEAAPDAAADAATSEPATTATETTSTTTTTETSTTAAAGTVVAATSSDIVAGAKVMDTKGGAVGTIEKVDANGAVIATGTARVQIPVASFAKNDQGLVISASKAELEAAAKQQPSL